MARRISFKTATLKFSVFDSEQYQFPGFGSCEVNYSHPAGFPRACSPPANFAKTTRLREDIASLGMRSEICSKLATLFFLPIVGPKLLKENGLDDSEHTQIYSLGV
jgi:hypothetical protein